MYSTCIHCHAALGSNESIEHFPVGQRLAFDAAKGRLWVVCARCRRWNLTPLEERWEAIEECERQFRGTRLRASTDNIGLARLPSGLELVRVGNPQRPEIAAWRYAANLRRRWLIYGVPGAAIGGGALVLQASQNALGVEITIGGMAALGAAGFLYTLRPRRARAVLPTGKVITIGFNRVKQVRLREVEGGWGISGIPDTNEVLTGAHAVHTLRSVATANNFSGARQPVIDEAVSLLSAAGDASRFIAKLAKVSERMVPKSYSPDIAVALEMALHEDAERRALEGELATLEAEWSMAEEIAKLADDMFLPTSVTGHLASLKAES